MIEETQTPLTDSVLLSALRGRVLAIIGSILSLWAAYHPIKQAVIDLMSVGATTETVGAVMTQATVTMDAAQALVIAGGSFAALAASAISKYRSVKKQSS